ncbi:antitoxin PrlF [Rhizobium aquaticum]|uniref:Antitoxin PrlF n=1 Tax=Rhizobium aquaticum TaxID=1549636 RepID=A0ABV2IXU2_9HYPH
MPALLKKISAITEKGQVTIPKAVREALGVEYGGRVAFYVNEDRTVSIRREKEEGEDDPLISRFLNFLAEDMAQHPDRIQKFPPALVERMVTATEGMQIDPEAPIDGDVVL